MRSVGPFRPSLPRLEVIVPIFVRNDELVTFRFSVFSSDLYSQVDSHLFIDLSVFSTNLSFPSDGL